MAGQRAHADLASLRFAVEVDSRIMATFSECSGLSATVKVESWNEGGRNDRPRKLPGQADFGNITLKHGISEDTSLYDWFKEAAMLLGQTRRRANLRRELSIILMTPDYEELTRWNFLDAFPVRWSGPSLSATQNAASIEEIELAHEGLLEV